MIRLDLATDRLMNISRKGSSQPTISPAGIPDDTVQTSLLVLCDAGIPDDTVQTSLLVMCGAGLPDDTVQTSLPVLCGASFPDDTVQTSLLVLCGAGLPDWKQEAQHAHCGGPVELYEDLKP